MDDYGQRDQEGNHAGSSRVLTGRLLKACKGVGLSGSGHTFVNREGFSYTNKLRNTEPATYCCYVVCRFLRKEYIKSIKFEFFLTALSSRNRLPSSWIIISFNWRVSIEVADLMAITGPTTGLTACRNSAELLESIPNRAEVRLAVNAKVCTQFT